jgi:hypothetical protein
VKRTLPRGNLNYSSSAVAQAQRTKLRRAYGDRDHCAFLPALASVLSQLHPPAARITIRLQREMSET